MRDIVTKQVNELGLFEPGQLVICAVSGGVDSMVMLSLLHYGGQPVKVAHVDHGLRGEESNADHDLVQTYAKALNLEFLSTKIDMVTGKVAGESTQMTARRMRYAWFEALLADHPGSVLATAHHRDDALETVLMGMVKGVGFSGLTGIPAKRGRIVRPLLCVGKQDILDHANAKEIPFREDKSNQDPKYLRNRIRNELVPLLTELAGNSTRPLDRFLALQKDLAKAVAHRYCLACAEADGVYWWSREKLRADPIGFAQALRGFDIHPDMIERIGEIVETDTFGQEFHSATGQLLVERERIVIRPIVSTALPEYAASSIQDFNDPILAIDACEKGEVNLSEGACVAWFDQSQLEGQVVLRLWKHGDRMQPWGLKGSKLVSDMLNEAGVSAREKERTYVLDIGGEIAWLVGHRIGDRFGVKERTERILRVAYGIENG